MSVPKEALNELHAVYERLSGELEPFRRHCDARGVCCNFTATGHMLYVTALEAAGMAASGRVPVGTLAEQGSCPFLDGKLCGVRDHRALGCRIYFCDQTYEAQRNEVYERHLKEVRAIEAKYGIAHSYQPVTQVDFAEYTSA